MAHDRDGGNALFTAAGLVPGSTRTECIDVTYTGSVTTTGTKSHVSSLTDSDGGGGTGATAQLSDDLDVTVKTNADGVTCALWADLTASIRTTP